MSAKAAHFPSTRRYLRDVSEALFYRGTPLPAQRLDFVEREAMATLISAGRRARLLFSTALFLVAWLAPLWVRRLPTITRLPLPLRITAIAELEASPLGAPLLLGLKTVLCFIYYEQPEALRELGQVSSCARSPLAGPSLPVLSAAAAPATAASMEGGVS